VSVVVFEFLGLLEIELDSGWVPGIFPGKRPRSVKQLLLDDFPIIRRDFKVLEEFFCLVKGLGWIGEVRSG